MIRKVAEARVARFLRGLNHAWFDLMAAGILRYAEIREMRVREVYTVWRIADIRKMLT